MSPAARPSGIFPWFWQDSSPLSWLCGGAQKGGRQAAAAEQAVLDGRYQRGIEMLVSDSLSARLGGIYSLKNLAKSQPEQYHIQVMRVFFGVVRHPPLYDSEEAEKDSGRAEAEANPFESNLSFDGSRSLGLGASLMGADLTDANLGGCNCSGTDMTGAILHGTAFATVFTGTKLWAAMLSSANL